jgi:hypothetical protein
MVQNVNDKDGLREPPRSSSISHYTQDDRGHYDAMFLWSVSRSSEESSTQGRNNNNNNNTGNDDSLAHHHTASSWKNQMSLWHLLSYNDTIPSSSDDYPIESKSFFHSPRNNMLDRRGDYYLSHDYLVRIIDEALELSLSSEDPMIPPTNHW